MKKKLMIIVSVVVILIVGVMAAVHYHDASSDETGVNLDCARMFCRPTTLKKYINLIHSKHGNYLQLHLTDNQNFAVENKYLHQTPARGYQKNGIWYNSSTHRPFLTLRQLKMIIDYGKRRGVQVYPEIDVPAHCKALYGLLRGSHKAVAKKILMYPDSEYTRSHDFYQLDYTDPATVQAIEKILNSYLPLLPRGSRIGLGGDETVLSPRTSPREMVGFFNTLDDYVNQHHMKTIMYNDSFYNSRLMNASRYYYNKDILINYWSQSGAVDSSDQSSQTRDNLKDRETLRQLNRQGYKTVNNNSAYLYLVFKPRAAHLVSLKAKKKLRKWKPAEWYGRNDHQIDHSSNNIGTSVSIWGDSSGSMSKQEYQSARKFLQAYFKNVH